MMTLLGTIRSIVQSNNDPTAYVLHVEFRVAPDNFYTNDTGTSTVIEQYIKVGRAGARAVKVGDNL